MFGLTVVKMTSDTISADNQLPWYEEPDGTCRLDEPTLVNMGEEKPLHLMFPIQWDLVREALPDAIAMAKDLNAMLVLLIYGEAADSEIASLIVEFASNEVLPLWIGEQNRKKVQRIIEILSVPIQVNE
jgi:hypothetical protein